MWTPESFFSEQSVTGYLEKSAMPGFAAAMGLGKWIEQKRGVIILCKHIIVIRDSSPSE